MQIINKNDSSIDSGGGKEVENTFISGEIVKEVSGEIEVPIEVERFGVKKFGDVVELPPDVKKLGVSRAGPSTPVSSTSNLPQVTLPISDKQVLAGFGASVTSAFLWLAVWCMKKLNKAHVKLKVIGGKIIRVKT